MILLAYPPFKEGGRSARWQGTSGTRGLYFMYPPWYLAYSAALIEKENLEVNLVDAVAEDMTDEGFFDYVNKLSPELLITEPSTLTIDKDLQLMKRIKENTGCKIALAGTHATALHNQIMQDYPFIDFILLGEYELTALELAKNINLPGKYSDILGLVFRKGNTFQVNGRRPLIQNLDSLPLPARHFLPMDRYNEAFAEVPNQQLWTSRGCVFNCVFCVLPQTFYNRTVRYRSPEKVIDEVEMLVEKYKPKEIYFDDDSFTLNPNHTLGICREIKKRKLDIRWSAMGHAKITEEVLKEMVDSGCVGIKFGVESASPEVQQTIKKRLNIQDVKNFNKLAKKFSLRTHATYMIGLPGDTKETIEKTLKLAVTLGTDMFQISIATPYPGTEFYEWAKTNNYLVTSDFSRYDGNKEAVISYPNLSKEEIDSLFRKALDLTSRLDFGVTKFFVRQEIEKNGTLGFIPVFFKEGARYANRLLKKHTFKLKAKISERASGG